VRILVFHGYLLRGTGSNVYNASLAQALSALGHEVHLLCQDRGARELEWVDAVGRWEGGQLDVEAIREPAGAGSVTVYTPDIGGLLPVYVVDRYEGFEVKAFPDLSDSELDRYLDSNVAAVRDVVARAGEPDAALANHLIMGPVILARAGLEFAAKVHGSDLSYTVAPHPERFVPFAREGADAASGLLVGSRHTAEQLWETLPDAGLDGKTGLGPPGVDVELFRPRPAAEAGRAVAALADRLGGEAVAGEEDSFSRDGPAAAAALREWSEEAPRVLFVGKLLVNKGVDLLTGAWPLVRASHPDARLLLVGFGDRRKEVERSVDSSVSLSGRLEHAEVAEVLPAADVFVLPSIFPEAFGMVAAEAAACGVPTVSADHSGMREVSLQLAEAVGPELAPLLSFPVDGDAVEALAERINGWLALDPARVGEVGEALAGRVEELWSWRRVAEDVIAASGGSLNRMPPA
jgi:glycosyltransferase involved in cell wall biosynthesis